MPANPNDFLKSAFMLGGGLAAGGAVLALSCPVAHQLGFDACSAHMSPLLTKGIEIAVTLTGAALAAGATIAGALGGNRLFSVVTAKRISPASPPVPAR